MATPMIGVRPSPPPPRFEQGIELRGVCHTYFREREDGTKIIYDAKEYPGTVRGLERVVVLPWNEFYTDEHVAFIATADPAGFHGFLSWAGNGGSEQVTAIGVGAGAGVALSLIAQIGEQVDYLRFMPEKSETPPLRWWGAVLAAGPGWVILGAAKQICGAFLAFYVAGKVGFAAATEPIEQFLGGFGSVIHNDVAALALATLMVLLSQVKINVTNAYSGSLSWSNFFSRLLHVHPGRVVYLGLHIAIALALMLSNMFAVLNTILGFYSNVAIAWVGAITALTAQNTQGVQAIHAVPAEFLRAQLASVLGDIGVDAVKIGMLHTPEVVRTVAWAIEHYGLQRVVLDPVMVATSGDRLIAEETVDVLVRELNGSGTDFVAVGAGHLLGPDGLEALVTTLLHEGYRVVGPTVRDGAIVLDELKTERAQHWLKSGALPTERVAIFFARLQIVARLQTQHGRDAATRVTGHEQVVVAFRGIGVAHQAPFGANRCKIPESARDELVRINLVAGVPDQAISGEIEHLMQGDAQLDHAEIAGEVGRPVGHHVAQGLANLARQLDRLFLGEVPQIARRLNPRQQFEIHQ